MADYSKTPLARKLGIKEGFRVLLVDPPSDFEGLIAPLPPEVEISRDASGSVDLVMLFVQSRSKLEGQFRALAAKLTPAGMLWVAWPKKSSKVPTDLDFNGVQRVGLEEGLVDTKVCAIDNVWSGIRFVFRVRDRGPISQPNPRR